MYETHFLILLLLIPVVASCRSQTRTSGDRASRRPDLAIEDTMPDTAGCDLVRDVLHPDPSALVTEFLQRDTTGDFTSSNAWHAGAHTCPGRAPGWDTYTIVTGYRVVPLRSRADTSRYQVSFDVYANAVDDSFHELARATVAEVDTFVLLRTRFGWRIDTPVIPPHISPAATLRIMQIRDLRPRCTGAPPESAVGWRLTRRLQLAGGTPKEEIHLRGG